MDATLARRRNRLEQGLCFEDAPQSTKLMAVLARLHMAARSVGANLPEHVRIFPPSLAPPNVNGSCTQHREDSWWAGAKGGDTPCRLSRRDHFLSRGTRALTFERMTAVVRHIAELSGDRLVAA
jgi:hypothetical protein